MMVEVGYVHTAGKSFPLQRWLSQVFDRQTGAKPAGWNIGAPGGYYVDSRQTMDYNALQTSVRRRFAHNVQFDLHYTLSKGTATQGGDLQAYYLAGDTINYTQDFFNPEADRGPVVGEARHRVTGDVIYEFPWLKGGRGFLPQVLGGWELSGIFRSRSGEPLLITQPSGIPNSRPDFVGGNPVLADWRGTLSSLNRASFALVPMSPVTTATLRPGSVTPDLVRGPSSWTVDVSLAKNFGITESVKLQLRAEAFNAFNHVNLNNPNSNFVSPEFGRITGAGAARTGQIGARLTF
jgi:hypothetical protein